jgi:pyruvate formate lyase activating enzyme
MVFHIQRFSTEDGPGIRTTVFLKGCALQCMWCQNPESWSPDPQIVWYEDKCIAAQHCISACPNHALTLTPQGLQINRSKCDACGACVPVCPTKALDILGSKYTVDEVVAKVLRDQPFYEESNGGVTLSGGDPLFQFHFSRALLMQFKQETIHTVIDTAGYSPFEQFQTLTTLADLILLDLKLLDAKRHLEYTGVALQPIIKNAKWLGTQEQPVWIRTPIIPGYTDDLENIRAIAQFIRKQLPNVERWDFLGYNNLCKGKWQRLDMPFPCEDTPLVSKTQMLRLMQVARTAKVAQLRWSGVTQEAAAEVSSKSSK